MIAILDVNAAIEILLQKNNKDKFGKELRLAKWVIAPDLYIPEISNVLWKYHIAGALNHADCIQTVEDGIGLIDDFIDSRDLWKESLSESIKNSHPVYDMLYAVLARRNDGTLITNDRQLKKICKKLNIRCVS